MKCPRCAGLVVEDWCPDLTYHNQVIKPTGFRCTRCGEIIDDIILTNRLLQLSQKS